MRREGRREDCDAPSEKDNFTVLRTPVKRLCPTSLEGSTRAGALALVPPSPLYAHGTQGEDSISYNEGSVPPVALCILLPTSPDSVFLLDLEDPLFSPGRASGRGAACPFLICIIHGVDPSALPRILLI